MTMMTVIVVFVFLLAQPVLLSIPFEMLKPSSKRNVILMMTTTMMMMMTMTMTA
jgi:hypothetical protein